jgi:predicted phage baseplate assembly protein
MVFEEDSKWHEWEEVNSFDASVPESRHYTVDLLKGIIRFGDGARGRIPPKVENIRILKYRIGGGEKGNVGANKITEVLSPELKGKVSVTNHRPAVDGVESEPLGEAKSRARRNFKEVTRSITTTDYETLTFNTPGVRVARVKVLPEYHPKFPAINVPGAVTVVVVPKIIGGTPSKLPAPSNGFLHNVNKHLKSRSIVTTNLSVIGPEFIEVKVAAKIRVDQRMSAETVRVLVLEALRKFLNPLTGGPDGKGWPFGRPVYRSEIYQVIESIAGVTCVDQLSLSGTTCDVALKDRITLRKISLVYSGEHTIAVC